MSNYAKILCYPEQLPPAIIHQIRREDMSMSGQASNMTFSDSAIQRAVIERVFDERKKYLIIALTGKIGAGSSYVSSFIQKASNGEEIPCSSSECNTIHPMKSGQTTFCFDISNVTVSRFTLSACGM